MNRINLPGKDRNKNILLIILVIVTIGLLFYEHNKNGKSIQNKIDNKDQQEERKTIDKKDEDKKNIINQDKEINNKDIGITSTTNDKKIYSKKENDLYNEAYGLFFSHEYADAISKANDLINEFPSNAMGYNIRGIAKDYDGGMKDINKSLEIDANYGYARFNKALTYELYENMDEALKWYNNDLEVEEYVWSYYGISSIYGRRGDINNTMKYLNKAIQMDDGVKEVAKTEHDFDPVKNFEAFKKAVYN
jgi:tetratricopeptide (TPR) repeat protein